MRLSKVIASHLIYPDHSLSVTIITQGMAGMLPEAPKSG
jgi:hypothetical protein